MADEKKRREISKEEYLHILTLPVKTMTVGGGERRGRFDEVNQLFYELNEDGELTGRVAHIQTPAPPPEEPPEEEDDRDTTGSGPAKKPKRKNRKRKERIPGPHDPAGDRRKYRVVLIGAILTALLIALLYGPRTIVGNLTGQFSGAAAVQEAGENGEPQSAEAPDSIAVVQVTKDVIPGDRITGDMIREASISAESYNLITLGGRLVYPWDRRETLIGSYISAYVPAGQYLTYADVSTVRPGSDRNPWIVDENIYTDIPVTEDMLSSGQLSFGSVMDLTIRKESVHETEVKPDENEETVPGLEHSASVQKSITVDTYTLRDIVLCDLLNREGESICSSFIRFLSIPEEEREGYLARLFSTDPGTIQDLTPAYITVCVTKEQMDRLGDLTADGVSITVSFTGEKDADTPEKKAFSEEAAALDQVIRAAGRRAAGAAGEDEANAGPEA